MDPISALLANGLGWAMEYFEPLRQMLDELTGKPDVVASHAATWNNMATELASMSKRPAGRTRGRRAGLDGHGLGAVPRR